jgi:GNAT superfamily N-acetyltransferase
VRSLRSHSNLPLMPDPLITIDPVTPEDVPLVMELIHELAVYEREPESVKATPEMLHRALFGEPPACEAVIARFDGQAAGWAIWFQTFSTWTGRPGLWLEDLFVRPEYRRKGIGKALLVRLARICNQRGYGRFQWSVLDWNEPALEFYRSLGAIAEDEWTTHRITGEALDRLAEM